MLKALRCFFFFNDTATTEIYTLSLHDALPISIPRNADRSLGCKQMKAARDLAVRWCASCRSGSTSWRDRCRDRKSTRLNSSHGYISYAVFCLKKKKKQNKL